MLTDTVLLIRPTNFCNNPQTASTNIYQNEAIVPCKDIQKKALKEFNNLVKILKSSKINVIVVKDTEKLPDAIFPNWITTHENDTIILYPMHNENRRLERKIPVVKKLKKLYRVKKTIDLTKYENIGLSLEGFGSIVLDRKNKIGYSCISPRTSDKMLNIFTKKINYKIIKFEAFDKGIPIYHTDIILSIGDDIAIVCKDTIKNPKPILNSLKKTGHEIIEINLNQLRKLACNCMHVINKDKDRLLIISYTAYNSLNKTQISKINKYCKIITAKIDTIEKYGGGSVRCMILGIHLKPYKP